MNMFARMLIFSAFLVVYSHLQAQNDTAKGDHKVTLKGYVKYLEQVEFTNNATDLVTSELIHNRLNFRYRPDDRLTVRLEIRNRVYYGQLVETYPNFAALVTSS